MKQVSMSGKGQSPFILQADAVFVKIICLNEVMSEDMAVFW